MESLRQCYWKAPTIRIYLRKLVLLITKDIYSESRLMLSFQGPFTKDYYLKSPDIAIIRLM